MKKHIKINFSDFWLSFEKNDNYFTRLLSSHYDLEICEEPDFLIYSCFDKQGRLPWSSGSRKAAGKEYKKYRCIRIFYTSENVRPNFRECDYAFSFDYSDRPESYRLPFYGIFAQKFGLPFVGVGDVHPLVKGEDFEPERILKEKTRFCNFIYGNRHAQKREAFFEKLNQYKKVDSAGTRLNNVGYRVTPPEKLNFIKQYKFTFAFENTSYPGYTTEKIVQPMLVNSLPIYWGNPSIDRDFNSQSFLNYYDFESEEELIERIIELDKNDNLYLEYLKQPYFPDNRVNEFIDPRNVLKQFDRIFNTPKQPVAQQNPISVFFSNWKR